MAIRWVSNPESIQANQPSVLAIAETLAAMGVSVWIAVTWDTYLHIAIGALIAPLLLMRTDESCIWCAQITGRLYKPIILLSNYIDKTRGLRQGMWGPVLLSASLIWFPILMLFARIGAWAGTLARHPLVAFAAIPGNWRNATVVLDSKKWPDILPASDNVPAAHRRTFDVRGMIEGVFRKTPRNLPQALIWLYALVIALLVVVPTFAYRWSLKSTAIIWFPLLWAMGSVRKAGKSFPEYLSAHVRSPFSLIVLCISIAVIVTFLGKIILWSEWSGFVEWWNAAHWRGVLSLYVTPQEIQWWQVAMFVNSIIAIAMYLLAVQWLVLRKYRQITTETLPRGVFQVGLFIRPILSGYTIACALYITIRAASDWALPALGTKLFPWM